MNTKPRYIDLTGQKFNRLTVIDLSHINKNRIAVWNCLCDCGNIKTIASQSIRNGSTKSCGCIKHELDIIRLKTHGYTANKIKNRSYGSWTNLKNRCLNTKCPEYSNYGGRGITVCERWLNSFQNFLEDMGERPIGKTLDRFPNQDGNYEPNNCRWATPKQQGENTRKNRIFKYNDKSMNISDWAKYFDTDRSNMLKHIKKGRTMEQIHNFYEYKKHNNIRKKPFLFD